MKWPIIKKRAVDYEYIQKHESGRGSTRETIEGTGELINAYAFIYWRADSEGYGDYCSIDLTARIKITADGKVVYDRTDTDNACYDPVSVGGCHYRVGHVNVSIGGIKFEERLDIEIDTLWNYSGGHDDCYGSKSKFNRGFVVRKLIETVY